MCGRNAKKKRVINIRIIFTVYSTPLYLYTFVVYPYAAQKRMAENSRMSKLSSKDDECVFSWKLFTGWDYMIGE